ncbi:MAG: 1-acyl-sn-glycerol-3-phosphate acyltransferase [Pyrinomonadaceae bacterium]|nr:1-acyl-sn-glycerol-3-phosphate acyltransferase [Pyrinomonadaceae bacterium]
MDYIRATFRFSAFILGSFALYGTWFAGNLIIPNKQYWRQIVFRIWALYFIRLSAMRIEILGDVPKPPFFLVSNHVSYTDIPLLRAILDCVFVAKGEISGWFLAGRIVRDMANIFVDRTNRRDIPRAGEEVLSKLNDGEGVVVFPEGTSTKGEEVLPFNSSFFEFAARAELPIHYASISYRTDESGKTASDYICWWDDTTFIPHLFRFFRLKSPTAIVSFGCETVVNQDRKEIARQLWNRVNSKFVPMI